MAAKRVDKEAKRVSLGLVAMREFLAHGVEGTSIAKIAKAAGIGKGSVYEYVRSKEELLLVALTSWFAHQSPDLSTLYEEGRGAAQRIRRYVEHLVTQFTLAPERARINTFVAHLLMNHRELLQDQDFVAEGSQQQREALTRVIGAGIESDEFRACTAIDIEAMVTELIVFLDGLSIHFYLHQDPQRLRVQLEHYVERWLTSLRQEQHS